MDFAIIGAGMAGLACADALKDAGHNLALFDKGRGPGCRMSTRRMETPLGDVAFDHGAQYFTARDPGFRRLTDAWCAAKIVLPWPAAGVDTWVGIPGMNAPVRHMAASHAVAWGRLVTGIVRNTDHWWLVGEEGKVGPFKAVILAIPAEQAAAILSLHDFPMARFALMARSQPCWTGMFVFDRPLDDVAPVIRNQGEIAWATRNSAKPGRCGPEAWVIQANACWTNTWLEAPQEQVSAMLLAALAEQTGRPIQEPIAAASHRWRYALSAGTGDGALWNHDLGLGACGDWLLGPRVECAWLSGRMMADRIHQFAICPYGHVEPNRAVE